MPLTLALLADMLEAPEIAPLLNVTPEIVLLPLNDAPDLSRDVKPVIPAQREHEQIAICTVDFTSRDFQRIVRLESSRGRTIKIHVECRTKLDRTVVILPKTREKTILAAHSLGFPQRQAAHTLGW